MRKGLISPGVLFAGIVLFSIILMYGERSLDGRHPSAAIPEPSDGTLFLYFEEKSGSWLSVLPQTAAQLGKAATSAAESFRLLAPLFDMAGESSCLLTWEENAVHFYIGVKFPGDVRNAFSEGVVPEEIAPKLENVVLQELQPGIFVMTRDGDALPLYLCVNDGIVFFASSKERIERMLLTLERQAESIARDWKIERKWPSHLLFSDGGLFSGMAAMEGFPAAKGTILVSVAWRGEPYGGRVKWKANGLEDIFPPSFIEGLRSVRWNARLSFPEPLLAAAGINFPWDASALVAREWRDRWEREEDFVEKILPGPSILSLCGSSKFLVFTLPGILLQLPERGKKGEDFVETFWRREWSALVPEIEKLDGFPAGGTTAIPFSILAAANFRMLQLGLIDRDALRHERFHPLGEYSPTLKNIDHAFVWAYFDMPKVGESLRRIVKAGRIAEKMGRTLRVHPNTLLRAASVLEELGKVSLIMPSFNEGVLEWRESGDRETDRRE